MKTRTISSKRALWLALVLWHGVPAGTGWCQEAPALPRGHVFFETDFESEDALKGWTRPGKLDAGCQSERSLFFERGADEAGATTMAELALPVEKMRGYDVYLTAVIKAENVVNTPSQYHGIRFMTRPSRATTSPMWKRPSAWARSIGSRSCSMCRSPATRPPSRSCSVCKV